MKDFFLISRKTHAKAHGRKEARLKRARDPNMSSRVEAEQSSNEGLNENSVSSVCEHI